MDKKIFIEGIDADTLKTYFLNIENMLLRMEQKLSSTTARQPKALMTRQDVIETLHISPSTLSLWQKKGIISHSKCGSKVYFKREDVEKILHQYTGRNLLS